MPAQNGTGPLGQGPLTGRGFGPCNPNAETGNTDYRQGSFFARGRGRGCGPGRGFGMGYNRVAPFAQNPETELQALKKQKEFLEERISNLETKTNA